MISPMPNLPDNIAGFIATGQVTANDYETVLIPAIELKLKDHDKIRIIYQLDASFEDFSAGAMWDDMKMGLAHINCWEKIAVVTDLEWLVKTTHLLGFAMPCPVKVFSNGELVEATDWITANN
jgi:hypothetical protein